ncbi:unnamed protein product, partial [Ranitomeya imitator]
MEEHVRSRMMIITVCAHILLLEDTVRQQGNSAQHWLDTESPLKKQHINKINWFISLKSPPFPVVLNFLCLPETGMRGPCSSGPCHNGGTCFHYLGKYKCDCLPHFSGRHCEKAELDCGPPEHVKYAKVIVTSTWPGGKAEYHCNEGYVISSPNSTRICSEEGMWTEAPQCEEIDECQSQPCQNGAMCKDRVSHFLCDCQEGYSGKHCELDVNECSSDPCKNGGTCQNVPGAYLCTCPEGFVGTHCETELDGCQSSPCQNGGKCENLAGSYLCVCPRGFYGYHCQTVSDLCLLNPCGSRGVCVSSAEGAVSCNCRTGYTGITCERDLLPPLSLSLGAVGENSVWIFWTPPEEGAGHSSDGFAVSYTAPDGSSRTDFVERGQTEHELRGLSPGRTYNVTIVTVKRNLRHNDISRPLTLSARTRPPTVDRPRVSSVTETSLTVSWSLSPHRHLPVAHVRLSLQHPNERVQQAEQEPAAGEYTFRDLLPGEKYYIQISTLSTSDPGNPSSESLPSVPLTAWTRSVDGYIFNVTQNHSTKSRYMPNGKLTSYTVRDLQPGQRYRVTATTLRNTPQGPVNSEPKTLRIQTLQREGPQEPRFTELTDGRKRITAKFSHQGNRSINITKEPEAPIRVENTDESSIPVRQALQLQDAEQSSRDGTRRGCLETPCNNGGTCVNGEICDCPPGYKGQQCQLGTGGCIRCNMMYVPERYVKAPPEADQNLHGRSEGGKLRTLEQAYVPTKEGSLVFGKEDFGLTSVEEHAQKDEVLGRNKTGFLPVDKPPKMGYSVEDDGQALVSLRKGRSLDEDVVEVRKKYQSPDPQDVYQRRYDLCENPGSCCETERQGDKLKMDLEHRKAQESVMSREYRDME